MRALPLLILMFVATDALAQYSSGLNLFWNRCHAGGGTASASFACDSSTGPSLDLIASIVIPADIPEFAGAMVTMDIWVSGAALPPWWQTNAGQCRDGAISARFDAAALQETGCPSIWMNSTVQTVFQAIQGLRGPYTLRLAAAAAVPEGEEIALVADGTEWTVARISISRAKSAGADACAGCRTPACLQFEGCVLWRRAGDDYFRVTNGTTYQSQFAFLNAPAPEVSSENVWWPCGIVPAVNRTWGAIKTLYR